MFLHPRVLHTCKYFIDVVKFKWTQNWLNHGNILVRESHITFANLLVFGFHPRNILLYTWLWNNFRYTRGTSKLNCLWRTAFLGKKKNTTKKKETDNKTSQKFHQNEKRRLATQRILPSKHNRKKYSLKDIWRSALRHSPYT